MPNLRFILVEPKEAGNVGAAARVMKNFGFDELWIVGRHPELRPGWSGGGGGRAGCEARRFARVVAVGGPPAPGAGVELVGDWRGRSARAGPLRSRAGGR